MSLRRRERPARLAAVVALVLALTLGALGCGRGSSTCDFGPQSDLAFLKGRLVSDRQVVALPGARWGGNTEGGKWTFKGMARIYCVVTGASGDRLAFHFTPDELTTEFWFTASWDGEPIFDEPQRPGFGDNVVTIPPNLVTEGLHTLTVERVDRLTAVDLRDESSNRFTDLGYSVGDQLHTIDLSRVPEYRHIAMLVARGVTGVTHQKMAGCLFEGPRTAVAALDWPAGATVSFAVDNGSASAARFTLGVGENVASVSIGPLAVGTIEVTAEPGSHQLRLVVDGHQDGLFLWGAPQIKGPPRPEAPPVVIVTLDTTRRDALSPWGGPRAASPHLQAFTETATVFDNAWAVSPWTLPSHATVFTGLYPYRHGAGVFEDHLGGRFETLAEMLSGAGYFTAGFAGGAMSAAGFGVAQGFDLYLDPDGFQTRGDALMDSVEELLSTDPSGPLFLFVNFFDPHALYEAPPEFEQLFNVDDLARPIQELPVWRGLVQGNLEAWGRLIVGDGQATPEALAYLRASYLAEVAFMDSQIGRLLEALDERGLFDPALIVFVADHGELLGEGGLFSHCCRLDPELVLVPLMIKWPRQKERPAGRTAGVPGRPLRHGPRSGRHRRSGAGRPATRRDRHVASAAAPRGVHGGAREPGPSACSRT